MKNCIFVFVFLSALFSANSQTPISFYPSYDPLVANFGSKVDLDGNEIIVSNSSGVVYLFEKNDNGLLQKEFIEAPDASDGTFGYSISIQNNCIAVGDPLNNTVAVDAGLVYMYRKTVDDVYDLQQIIPAPEATSNYHFGSCVKVFGNRLFIAADNKVYNQNASANNGAVYCYVYDGLAWVFQQKLEFITLKEFGKKIEVNDNILAIYTQFDTNQNHQFSLYKLDNTNSYSLTGGIVNVNTLDVYDFCLDGNVIYTLSGFVVNRYIINEDGTNQAAEIILNLGLLEQKAGSIAASNDNLFVGSTGYTLQMTRNFPLLHYKKTGNTWSYHNTYFGTGASGEDDYFGSVLASKGNQLIIGAPIERVQLPMYGNAYYLDFALATDQFERNGFSLFPNPTSDRVFVDNNLSLAISKIEIYSVSGKLLQAQNTISNEISLENFSKGLYFAKIYTQNEVSQTFKIVKN